VLSACARAGIGKIDIIDFDRISLSSLNRHAFATRRHVNRSKVEIFKDFFKELVPNIDLTIHEAYVTVDNV
jgi:tRNA A37 threonylcarbamoyladenosine dehydratase